MLTALQVQLSWLAARVSFRKDSDAHHYPHKTSTPPLGGRVTHPSLQRPEVWMVPLRICCRPGESGEMKAVAVTT